MKDESANLILGMSNTTKRIFGLLQKEGPVTKNDLMVMAKMKLSTLNRHMMPLIDHKIIVETGLNESTGGRKPVLYDVNGFKYYLIGIDISRTYTQIVVTNLKMEILDKQNFPMKEICTPNQTVRKINEIAVSMLDKLSIAREGVIGIGVGTVGPLDRMKGMIINPRNFASPDWINVPIKSMIEDQLHLPVFIDNGVNAAVLSEFLHGEGRSMENIIYVNCGIGIRTGAISSGTIIRSINDAEDAFGHMVIDVDGELCSCGNFGCIECYSSAVSIVNKFISGIKRGRSTSIAKSLNEITIQDICMAAKHGDELSREVILSAAAIFGAGLANYINILNPDLVILSGLLIRFSDLFFELSTDVARKRYYLKDKSKVIFSRGGYFQDNAIAVGAASMVIEGLLKESGI